MALDTMGFIGGKDILQEISMRLEESHLAYLQLDESPLKLQARQKLEGFIKEYLCHVPNERKYIFQETADILHRSAATVKDFSGYRACTAWRALSLYAANLLAQPWRKEYRTLRTYSGYYKHEIEANLIGGELMFELMGYKHTGLGILTLEGPIDPDRVSSVSRDAIVAFVECQILAEIWESVSQNFTVSWLDVLEFRWNSVGTSEQAIRALNFRYLERMHHSREKHSTKSYRDYSHHVQQPLGMDAPLAALLPGTMPYHVMTNNYNTAMLPTTCKPDSIYPSDGNFYFTPIDPGNSSNRSVDPYACRPAMNHYYPMGQTTVGNPMTSIPSHAARVPTGRLIELDSPALPTTVNYDRNRTVLNEISNKSSKSRIYESESDEIDYRRNPFSDRQDYARVEKRSGSKLARNLDEKDKLTRNLEEKEKLTRNLDEKDNDWEFVYKGLESLGYSKDLGERDDVLRKKELMLEARNSTRLQQKNARSLVNVDHDDKYEKYGTRASRDEKRRLGSGSRGINFNDVDLEIAHGQENRARESLDMWKKGSLDLPDSIVASGESFNERNFGLFEKNGKKYSNTMPSSRNLCKSVNEAHGITRKVDLSRDNNKQHEVRKTLESDRWSCATCTFFNSNKRDICEMCGKSRRKGNEDKPLASGGKECPQCTLVNEKNAATCEACAASLKDSPTYI